VPGFPRLGLLRFSRPPYLTSTAASPVFRPRFGVPTFTRCTVSVEVRLPLHPNRVESLILVSHICLSIFSLLAPSMKRMTYTLIVRGVCITAFRPIGTNYRTTFISIPYRRFEIGRAIETSYTDSTSHHLGLAMFDHRLADLPGSCDVLLICIFIGASHRLSLIVFCVSDSS